MARAASPSRGDGTPTARSRPVISALAQGYAVMIQTAAAPSDRHATWYITYSKEQAKDPGVTVIVDANTGSVEKVLKD